MKKMMTLFAIVFVTLLAGCSDRDVPQEGKQFQTLSTDLSTYRLPQVTEVFSLNCGHCKKMESVLPQLEELTQQNIGKVHVTFNDSAKISAMIYYTAEMQLGQKPDHSMMNELFQAAQMGNNATMAEKKQAIIQAFQSRGLVSPYELKEENQNQLFKAMQLAENLTEKGQINSVPTFIINGKYMVLTSGHKDVQDIANTINYLTQQP
ncbi:thiol:disulfide interchange protein DsbA/DsbL [Vibrio sp. Isolate25]|uniref:thiol:disulfide interchange protein DsbA/DsbL n=1 Tax=unclassified Vibrio TaxID=2614977 RepID=UPI001EFD514C|nr:MULTISPECIES: thiol:disulfide interchange protein DsbA/DsbL [unclassified Vibrio]MCG9595610.1 thiol:disulfide interchange protein DsbA/DsbL [Vibrio sp. Isolate25]MCG9681094.1 thiol:disulfide interchange protein DsbA/DsbL [Vibrio sp. Isolate23]